MTYRIKWTLDPALALTVPVIDLSDADDARKSLAHVATIESFALLRMLRREQAHDRECSDDMFDFVFGTTMRRLIRLNSVTIGAVSFGPGRDSPAELADMLFGSDGWRDSRDPDDPAPTKTFTDRPGN